MLKAADAIATMGHRVRVVATRHEPWATDADVDVRTRRSWPLTVVDYSRATGGATYWTSGFRYRSTRALTEIIGAGRAPFAAVARAFGRVHPELVRAAVAEPTDLFYGGTTGALAAVAEAGRRRSVPYAIDFEDLHSAEASGDGAVLAGALARRVERRVLEGATFVTTSSDAIASAYHDAYGASPVVVANTFPLPPTTPDFHRRDPTRLRVYWFSQTIGPGRGLEDAIAALGVAGVRAELTVRGRAQDGYIERLRALASSTAPQTTLVHAQPAPPDAMVDLARGFDVGLALEQMTPRNRQLCVTNKAFTYILAGVAVAISDTPGQHALGRDLGAAAALVPPGDVGALAAALRQWAADGASLDRAKRCAWQAACQRWHWEDESQRGRLMQLVDRALAARS
jgi:glycosyltransferase involved in cell wall biosynthesis